MFSGAAAGSVASCVDVLGDCGVGIGVAGAGGGETGAGCGETGAGVGKMVDCGGEALVVGGVFGGCAFGSGVETPEASFRLWVRVNWCLSIFFSDVYLAQYWQRSKNRQTPITENRSKTDPKSIGTRLD